jgi:hypothetical protein
MEKNKVAKLPEFLYKNEADILYGDAVIDKEKNLVFDREMAELSDEMVSGIMNVFDDAGVLMDQSDESIEDLDRLAAQLWPEPMEEEEALDAIVASWGAYIGEVIRENLGGNWLFRKDLEHASVHFPRTDLEVFPFHKDRKRLVLGAEESLSDFYEALVEELTEDA